MRLMRISSDQVLIGLSRSIERDRRAEMIGEKLDM